MELLAELFSEVFSELMEEASARLDEIAMTDELLLMSELEVLDETWGLELAGGALEPPPPPPQPIIDARKLDNSSAFIIFMVSLWIIVKVPCSFPSLTRRVHQSCNRATSPKN